MRATTPMHDVFTRLRSAMAALQRRTEFTCGDCERSDRCGLPPSDSCIVRAAQMARGDWKSRRRIRALSPR